MQAPDAESMEPEPFPSGLPSVWVPPTPPVDSYPQQLTTPGQPQPQLVGFVAPPPATSSSPTMFSPSHSEPRRRYLSIPRFDGHLS